MSAPEPMQGRPIEFPLRVAAIDMGSNALRFVAAEFSTPREYRVMDSERVAVRLGHSSFRTHFLDLDLMEQAVAALSDFRRRMDALKVQHHRAVATSAVRESRNGRELAERIREKTGIRVETITGVEEGRLVWRAVGDRIALQGRRWILADLGGGSVEVSLADSAELRWTESLPLGTVRLLEELDEDSEAPTARLRRLLEEYAAALHTPLGGAGEVAAMIATGGNAEALADLAGVAANPRGVRRLDPTTLDALVERLASLSVRERIEKLGLREDRADVILPAAIVYKHLAAIGGIEAILVPNVGLKEGVLLDLIDDLMEHRTHEERRTREVEEGALALGRRHDFDEAHARQVTRLALCLFDELADLHELGEEDRRILLAGALLHDIGHFVASRQHHKHSRYLVLHSQLPGLDIDQIALAALVARYHRRAEPKPSHPGYGRLGAADRRRVDRMAALLRVADALDREHRQEVESMLVEREDGVIRLRLRGRGDILLEKWALKKKRRLFERIFERRLRVAVEARKLP